MFKREAAKDKPVPGPMPMQIQLMQTEDDISNFENIEEENELMEQMQVPKPSMNLQQSRPPASNLFGNVEP